MIDHRKPLDEAQVAKKLANYIVLMRYKFELTKQVVGVMKQFNNKTLNKRTITMLQAALPKHTFTLSTDSFKTLGYKTLYVWGDQIHFDARMSYYISGEVFSYDDFVRGPDPADIPHDQRRSPGGAWSYLALSASIAKAELLLERLPESIAKYNAAQKKFHEAVAEFNDFSNIIFTQI